MNPVFDIPVVTNGFQQILGVISRFKCVERGNLFRRAEYFGDG
ncbi:hypothetical protein HMPREF1267_00681 [Corynebacterium sp. KPL1824]|uniref:Uncharacterized protein n=1 Tax=Corynebacterium segmentosum TaxID=43990 RepID=A0ABY6TBP3_9CORY|nr:hypothetical protein HMPREF1267_00681 [Corynebacterium sp. KPL1824]VEH72275.1 Uncharacterised protein [Corynebacterium segmentosum]